jgi:hypothetical protein
LWLNGERRFTWCAYDTIGIFAALGWDGRIRSQTPLHEPVELEVVGGRASVTDNAVAARRWASDRGIDGQVVSLAEASELGARERREAALSARDARSA